jgi:hypothetical protein
LRARPETQAVLARQLDISRRLDLLRRPADPPKARAEGASVPSTDTHFLQDVVHVGETSRGEAVYLVLSVVVDPSRWNGGWFIGIVPLNEIGVWQAYLASAREAIVTQLGQRA